VIKYGSAGSSLFWDSLGLPVVLNQLAAYTPDSAVIYVDTLLLPRDVEVTTCGEGHVHVAIGLKAPYVAILAGFVRATAAARLLAADRPVTTEATRDEVLALLAAMPRLFGELPAAVRAAMFEGLAAVGDTLH
jgi:hypothetical protein